MEIKEIAVKALLQNENRRPVFRTTMHGGLWTPVNKKKNGEIFCNFVKIKRGEDEQDKWEEIPSTHCQLAPTHRVTLVGDLAESPPKIKGLA